MRIILLFSLWFLSSVASAGLVLGVHPFLEASVVIKRFQPLADYLSRELQIPVEVRVGRDYQSHIDAIGNDQIDIAFLGPAPYVKVVNQYGKKPVLARLQDNGKPLFHGHIVVRSDTAIRRLQDLQDKFFAFGDKNSTMSSLAPQAMLRQHGIKLENLSGYRFFKGHNNVALAVLAGDTDAGAVKEEVFLKYQSKGLRSVAMTPAISEHLFVTRSNLDPKLIKRIRQLLLKLHSANQIENVLHPIKKSLTGLAPVHDADYDSMRRIMDVLK